MVERERFGLEVEAPDPPFREPNALREGLRLVLGRYGRASAAVQETLLKEWPQLVGEEVARRTRPGMVRDRELTVFVRGSVWYSELKRNGARTIQDRIVARLGSRCVDRVALRPDPEGRTEQPGDPKDR